MNKIKFIDLQIEKTSERFVHLCKRHEHFRATYKMSHFEIECRFAVLLLVFNFPNNRKNSLLCKLVLEIWKFHEQHLNIANVVSSTANYSSAWITRQQPHGDGKKYI